MSDEKPYGGRARLSHNLSGYEYLVKKFNRTIANEMTSFKTGLSPREVEIGYRFTQVLSKAKLDLMLEAEELNKAWEQDDDEEAA